MNATAIFVGAIIVLGVLASIYKAKIKFSEAIYPLYVLLGVGVLDIVLGLVL